MGSKTKHFDWEARKSKEVSRLWIGSFGLLLWKGADTGMFVDSDCSYTLEVFFLHRCGALNCYSQDEELVGLGSRRGATRMHSSSSAKAQSVIQRQQGQSLSSFPTIRFCCQQVLKMNESRAKPPSWCGEKKSFQKVPDPAGHEGASSRSQQGPARG